GQLAPSFAGTVGRRVRNGSGRTMGGLLERRGGGPAEADGRSGRCPPPEEGSVWAKGWGRRRVRPGPGPRSSGRGRGTEADRSKSPPMVPTRHGRGHGRDGAGRRGARGNGSP